MSVDEQTAFELTKEASKVWRERALRAEELLAAATDFCFGEYYACRDIVDHTRWLVVDVGGIAMVSALTRDEAIAKARELAAGKGTP